MFSIERYFYQFVQNFIGIITRNHRTLTNHENCTHGQRNNTFQCKLLGEIAKGSGEFTMHTLVKGDSAFPVVKKRGRDLFSGRLSAKVLN